MMNTKKPISEARLRANRANAQKSTGPRTPAGKQRSSRNALVHGLTAQSLTPRDLTILGENYDLLPQTIRDFKRSWNPRTPYEASLIEDLAALHLRLARCARMETGLFDAEMPNVSPNDSHESISHALSQAFIANEARFMNCSRYETTLSRAYDRTFKQLLAARKNGLEPLDDEPLSSADTPEANFSHDETKPFLVANNEVPSPTEPSEPAQPNRRLELDTPVSETDAAHRRLGALVPCHKPARLPKTLVFVNDDGVKSSIPQAARPKPPVSSDQS